MKTVQDINGTKFYYEVVKQVGTFRGKKIYKLKNIETGFVCNMFEFEIKILNDL